MVFHVLAFIICFVGLVVLTIMGEPGALQQLIVFLFLITLAFLVFCSTILLLCS